MIGKTQGVSNATKPDKNAANAKPQSDLSADASSELNVCDNVAAASALADVSASPALMVKEVSANLSVGVAVTAEDESVADPVLPKVGCASLVAAPATTLRPLNSKSSLPGMQSPVTWLQV